jgi:formylglycine-generating enzyme required for sulfatase activity
VRYCRLLSEREGVPDDQMVIPAAVSLGSRKFGEFRKRSGYRLPIEGEWEIACRAGTVTPRFFGHATDLLPMYSCYINNSEGHSWEVGTGLPNALGLFDMLGNVTEWCYDPYDKIPNPEVILHAPGSPPLRRYAGRGNVYTAIPRMLRSANRQEALYSLSFFNRGFRIAHTICPQPTND